MDDLCFVSGSHLGCLGRDHIDRIASYAEELELIPFAVTVNKDDCTHITGPEVSAREILREDDAIKFTNGRHNSFYPFLLLLGAG